MSVQPPGTIQASAHAKLNLFLHVIGRRTDGYHRLDSLIAFASVHDTIRAEMGTGLTLALDGPFGGALGEAGEDNLVLKAARGLAASLGMPADAALSLTKRLPLASGIGGGSADAAATIKALVALWRATPDRATLERLALSLGADVPMCLAGIAARIGGIGEEITPVAPLPVAGLLLVNPGVAVPTPAVFKARQGAFSTPAPLLPRMGSLDELVGYLAQTRNDLEAPARGIAPVIGDALKALRDLGDCRFARMSGSGATCFGLFPDERAAQRAEVEFRAARPGWWVASGRLISSTAQSFD